VSGGSGRLRGRLLTPQGIVHGEVQFGSVIERIDPLPGAPADAPLILPGFLDLHVHGGDGADTMDGPEGVRRLARFHLRHGVTTLLPTTITHPWSAVVAALEGVKRVAAEDDPTLPDLPGAHLEGPFIHPQRLGAQPPFAQLPTDEVIDELLALDTVRLATLAPEIEGALPAARRLAAAGVRIGIGHTRADHVQVAALLDAVRAEGGVAGFTHLFNAMGGMTGREPAVVGAALADAESYAELILDGHHVHPVSFRAALAAKPDRLLLISDAMRAAGRPEGESELGGQRVRVQGGAARLADGTLAGSVLTLDVALRNVVAAGVPVERAARLVSEVPAQYLGLDDRGRLEPGLRADLVVLDAALEVQGVYRSGRRVEGAS
jgi:N-acetylglucosamine-6-phosphate deacetylase